MAPRARAPRLVGTVQIAERLKVEPSTVRKWRERFGPDSPMHEGAPRFPEPEAFDGNRPLYEWDAVKRWRRSVDPWLRPGRPAPVSVG